jgi:transmembrane sensor
MRVADLSPPASAAPGFESLQQAAQWFALLRSDEATAEDRARWRAWIDQRREHREAWQYVENVGRRFEPLQSDREKLAAGKALKAANGSKAGRRRALRMIAVVSGAGMLGWAIVRETPLRDVLLAWRADYRTGTGEVREILLADGTRVWLNTASALNADYQTGLRRLRLVAGEVLIETAPDATRSFVVDTDHGRLHALGTRFTVRQFEDFTYLAVYEGAVEVRTAQGDRAQVIDAGQQVTFTRESIAVPTAAERARQAWARGILVADNIPLRDLIAELARYPRGHLGCAPEVAGIRVMGTFPLNDPERALALLQGALPVQVRRTLPWWVSVEARNR